MLSHKPKNPKTKPSQILTPPMFPTTLLFIFLLFSHTSDLGFKLVQSSSVIITGTSTILSDNKTFKLGFFTTNSESSWYFGISFASIPTPTYVWVANRETPVKNLSSTTVEITEDGLLTIIEKEELILWKSSNTEKSSGVMLLESGNLVLLSDDGKIVWQSFDFPTDTWLPGMNLTKEKSITCWRSSSDPSPGMYSLRLKPSEYGEFELVFNGSEPYWSTGKWTGNTFSGVPEMTIPYIYKFHFSAPFTNTAAFWYTETSLENGLQPLTRFLMDYSGQLKQFTWSPQTENWNMFWSQPDNRCKVYGLCGNFGLCNSRNLKPCECLAGFRPVDESGWNSGDFSGGCRRNSDEACGDDDGFEEVGVLSFDGAESVSFSGGRSFCEESCLKNCSCIGLFHNERTNSCKNLYGSLLNLRNFTSDSTNDELLYVRVEKEGITKKNNVKTKFLIAAMIGLMAVSALFFSILLILRRRKQRKKKEEEDDAVFPVTNLKFFTYKELQSATRGFSEKLGHGGFGVVFRGELSDSSLIAVKRLERAGGGGEKEFRAEVCTIGNIQHVNLVRLRGFCSENSHRLLVYDCMQNGSLSLYLKRDGPNLNWDVRFRIAIGTARGIAYLHEECRDCILHCDIKPENILLDGEFTAKVSDFGLAKHIGRDFSRVIASMRGTWGYVAPEWISGVAITTKADVYSYGMTLLELISGRRNVEVPPSNGGTEAQGGEKWFFPPWAARQIIERNVAVVVDGRLSGAYDNAEAERLGLVAVWCIQDDEAMRPTMGMVVKMLEGIVEVMVPPPPKLLQALVSGDSFRGVAAVSGDGMSTGGGCSGESVGVSGGSQSSLCNNSLGVNGNVNV